MYYFVYHSVVFSPCYFQENNKPILGQHNPDPVIGFILVAGRLPYAAPILYHFGVDMSRYEANITSANGKPWMA